MTGIVLALAGLTCGDGGPGMGAATAAVWATPRPDVRWEFEERTEGGGRVRVCLEGGRLSLEWGRRGRAGPVPVVFLPDGSFIFASRRCTYSLDGDRLTIRGLGEEPLTLRSAAPRKP
jgi:hypothetical protein